MPRATLLAAVLAVMTVGREVSAQSGWTQLSPGVQPGARQWHMLTFDIVRNVGVLFGGSTGAWLADTWEWNGAAWTQRSPAHSPPQRCCSGFGVDLARTRVVLFGGQGGAADLNDTWEYDGIDWVQRSTTQAPSPRRLPGFAFDVTRGGLVLFGGGTGSAVMAGDMWHWNGANWLPLQPAHLPAARWGFGMVTDFARGRILLHGGSNTWGSQPATFRDTWSWDGTDWTLLPTTVAPPPVLSFGMTYDWVRNTPVLFGGDPLSNQTWLLAGDTWVQDPRPGPAARWANMITFDLLRGRTLLFGGWGQGFTSLGDTWEYEAPALATWNTFGVGCAGSAGVPLLQSVTGTRPLLGTTFQIEVSNVPTNALAAMAIGFSATTWSGGSLPGSLASLGMPGCTLFASPDFPFSTPASGGRATLSWPLPNVTTFAGIPFFVQAIALDPGTNPLGAVVSNAGAGVIGTL